jgi:hypothetical protein
MWIVLDFVEPFVKALKRLSIRDIEDKKCCNRAFVIWTSYRFKGLLSRLCYAIITVSQICILILLPWVSIILDANSTPNVGSRSFLNLPSINRDSKQDLPTSWLLSAYLNHQQWCIWISSRRCFDWSFIIFIIIG